MVFRNWMTSGILIRIFIVTSCVFFTLSLAGASKGKPYFQQELSYHIKVTLNDRTNYLTGEISIKYKNNSNDTLSIIWMHLYPNAYKDRNTALCRQLVSLNETGLYFASEKERGFIDSLNFSVNDESVTFEYDSAFIDMGYIRLNQPLLPGNTILIETPFRIKLPSNKFSRLGHRSQTYNITQWYPKPAVYDRSGWHPMPYLNLGEFYSEFGNYEVQITIPSNYLVAATGNLQEKSEIEFLKLQEEISPSNTFVGKKDSVPPSSSEYKTITFKQDSIHDFAWFANKRFHVASLEFSIPDNDKVYTTRVFYTDKKSELWRKTPDMIRKGVTFLSEQVGSYAYNNFTVVDGMIAAGGGMEYPMITVINTPGSAQSLETTVFHELCHNWFYGMLANNERKYAWMDEGITSYYEIKYNERFQSGLIAGNNGLGNSGLIGNIVGINRINAAGVQNLVYNFSAFNNIDQPINTPSEAFTNLNYGAVVYAKTARAFSFLNSYLGDSVFNKCMQHYFNTWSFKHPQPDDLQSVFETVSGKKLSWFFDDLLKNNKPNRYEIKDFQKGDSGGKILIRNVDQFPIPLKIENELQEYIWVDGFTDTTSVNLPFTRFDKLRINNDFHPLFKSRDRPFRSKGICKRSAHLQFKMFHNVNDEPESETLYLLPVPAWNHYNQWMGGVYITNMDLLPEPFEFFLTPLYDFTNQQIAGVGGVDYSIWPLQGIFSSVKFSTRLKRFAYKENTNSSGEQDKNNPIMSYSKLAPSVQFHIRKKTPLATLQHQLEYRNISTWLEEVVYTRTNGVVTGDSTITTNNFHEFTYRLMNDRNIDPYFLNFRAENGPGFTKLSTEFNYRFSYSKNNKGVDIRLFAGAFADHNTNFPQYNFSMSGVSDYLYDDIYFGRTDDSGLWSQQFIVKEGGFKVLSGFGSTSKWLASANILIDFPIPLPVKFFFDIGTYEGISDVVESYKGHFMYDGGVMISPIKNVFEIYIPLFMSGNIKDNLELRNVTFAERIRFVFNLNKISPVNLRNGIIQSFQ